MASISHQTHNLNYRYLPHELKTRIHAVTTYRNGNAAWYVCRKYHISKASLMRWNKRYTGDKSSLMDRSRRPHTAHPNAHTIEELTWIRNLRRRNPHASCLEIYGKLRLRGYRRNPASLYRVMRKLGYIYQPKVKGTSKYVPKPYDTPSEIGKKWQIDVKYVPIRCLSKSLAPYTRYYQYTCIDEASRERYTYYYDSPNMHNTVDFIIRAIKYYGYKPEEIQTDNGSEFTWNKSNYHALHPMDRLCQKLKINHHKIRPRTPRHNGKVERSHRTDNERFYSHNIFFSLDDLRRKGAKYIRRYNDTPMRILHYKTPLEMRGELLPKSPGLRLVQLKNNSMRSKNKVSHH